MQLIDTHCHIHFADYGLSPDEVIVAARHEGVEKMICVGCTLEDSVAGVAFAKDRHGIFSSIGLHPHEASRYIGDKAAFGTLHNLAEDKKVVAVGEIGLDYYYGHSTPQDQATVLRLQLELALEHNLPVIFHVREAFDDFFAILSDFKGVRGVVHSFTAERRILDKLLDKGFYIGLNGIMTFTRDEKQLEMAQNVPLSRLLLETDAPFLTPVPFRGTICQPKHVVVTAKFLSSLRGETLEQIAAATTQNAAHLFLL